VAEVIITTTEVIITTTAATTNKTIDIKNPFLETGWYGAL